MKKKLTKTQRETAFFMRTHPNYESAPFEKKQKLEPKSLEIIYDEYSPTLCRAPQVTNLAPFARLNQLEPKRLEPIFEQYRPAPSQLERVRAPVFFAAHKQIDAVKAMDSLTLGRK